MSTWHYSDEELQQYFNDPRRRASGDPDAQAEDARPAFDKKKQAALVLILIAGLMLLGAIGLGAYTLSHTGDLPSLQQIENPSLDLSTVAYTADGKELQRYGRLNRSWVSHDEISPHVINALIATEDHRFRDHWGIDLFRTTAAVVHTILGDKQGGSTITQQLARNLYNDQIGFEVSVERKLREMVTAVQLERRYTKREIVEMYLNTIPFGYNAFGVEAAARTFFGKSAADLNVLESATIVGMLNGTTLYNPIRNPENSQRRRNVVLRQMVNRGLLSESFYAAHRGDAIEAELHSSAITESFAPYFAEHVRLWLNRWRRETGRDFYGEGLVVYTTMDSRLQEVAQQSVSHKMEGLQAVVNYEWAIPEDDSLYHRLGTSDITEPYRARMASGEYEPFQHLWTERKGLVAALIRDTDRFRSLRKQGLEREAAVAQLRADAAFMDSLKAEKTRLEAGLVSIDPRTGYVKAWVGGRDLKLDRYDHVSIARRQPGSTFKPFVYTAAIDNGYAPDYELMDSTFVWVDPNTGNEWSPQNSGRQGSREMLTLREGLARSKNTITGRLILEVDPSNVAFYARRMGIRSNLAEVPSLALGTSNVTLLEITSAYTTLASGGLHYEPIVVTRIEDRFGNVLYEATPTPTEALSEETAYTVIDMMRDVIRFGTGVRLRGQFRLGEFDLAGKTGTTQNGADGWFIALHPDLVTGAWVGFNDPRITFRSDWWGQGARNALLLVGSYLRNLADTTAVDPDFAVFDVDKRFPLPDAFGPLATPGERGDREEDKGRVGW